MKEHICLYETFLVSFLHFNFFPLVFRLSVLLFVVCLRCLFFFFLRCLCYCWHEVYILPRFCIFLCANVRFSLVHFLSLSLLACLFLSSSASSLAEFSLFLSFLLLVVLIFDSVCVWVIKAHVLMRMNTKDKSKKNKYISTNKKPLFQLLWSRKNKG